jgi:hypothetical protein
MSNHREKRTIDERLVLERPLDPPDHFLLAGNGFLPDQS